METIETDVVIVGGGPAGCSCALYTSRADLKTVILDKNPDVGALAITHQIANYPGVPTDISGEDLLNLMRDQCIQYGTDYRRAQVFGVDVNGDWKTVYTPEGTFKGRALVLASGAMGRPASFKGEADFLGKGVSYCATCDGAFYKNREVAVVGVNKEAIEESLKNFKNISEIAKAEGWGNVLRSTADKLKAKGEVIIYKWLVFPLPGTKIDKMELVPGTSIKDIPHIEGTKECFSFF